MTPTDTSEKGLESLIVAALTGAGSQTPPAGVPTGEQPGGYDNLWYVQGDPKDYDREHAADLAKLLEFLKTTQPDAFEALGLASEGHRRQAFLHRLQGEIAKRGIVEVLRRGVKDGPHSVALFYGTPSPGNAKAEVLSQANLFSVTRQLKYSRDESQLALDLCLFINGLPVATFELKNSLTKQTCDDAIQQYKRDRDPKELLFQFGRCLVHFAVDDQQVWMCTHLKGKASWFLPFNKGWNDGAGNPPNPTGLKTEYLWREILTRSGWTDILEDIGDEHRGNNFAILIDEAHSIQGGRTSAKMSQVLSELGAEEDDETLEDQINRIMESRKLLPNASYFAFTATPKNKTLEIFGEAVPKPDGKVGHRPFHSYTMKQAIQEGFILDVLKSYTPVASYYRLTKTVSDDPEYDTFVLDFQNAMKGSDRQNARIEHDKALQRVVGSFLADHTELFKQFQDNPSFKRWIEDTVFAVNYRQPAAG